MTDTVDVFAAQLARQLDPHEPPTLREKKSSLNELLAGDQSKLADWNQARDELPLIGVLSVAFLKCNMVKGGRQLCSFSSLVP